jgi:hypothetical protein
VPGGQGDATRARGVHQDGAVDGSEPGADAVGTVVSVSRDGGHRFSKPAVDAVRLLAGRGVEGDAHLGTAVKHRFLVRRDPTEPNLRQVHLLHAELLDDLADAGFDLVPGELGENVTTRGVDLLGLGEGALLHLGGTAVVRVTGLRTPCHQIEDHAAGLLRHVVRRSDDGRVERLAGVMGVVEVGGEVRPGDTVRVLRPAGPHRPLGPV